MSLKKESYPDKICKTVSIKCENGDLIFNLHTTYAAPLSLSAKWSWSLTLNFSCFFGDPLLLLLLTVFFRNIECFCNIYIMLLLFFKALFTHPAFFSFIEFFFILFQSFLKEIQYDYIFDVSFHQLLLYM